MNINVRGGLVSCLYSHAAEMFAKFVYLYKDARMESDLMCFAEFLRQADKYDLSQSMLDIFNFDVIAFSIASRVWVKELCSNGCMFHKALDISTLCLNSFWRVKSFLVNEYPTSKFLASPKPIVISDDWKNWFLLAKEQDAVVKYEGVIRAIEFSLNLSGDVVAEYDSVKIGMISLCCDKMVSLVNKLTENFTLGSRKSLLEDIEDISERLLSVKVEKTLLAALDEVLFRICREGGIPYLSFFREVDSVVDHVF